ncbi:MAG: SpoIIE family protein phosphatase [Vicinamibacteria bacterium]|nr:SpoIIE family protein phosphatase [Vicinamibacteria bacterium]
MGRRVIHIDKPVFSVGRRSGNDLQLVGSDVSRDHAEIATENGTFVLRDRGSRYGTYVNGEGITEYTLQHSDLIRLGRSGGAEMVFLLEDSTQLTSGVSGDRHTTSAVGDLRQIASLLEGLRALGSGRVLDEVLALVMDSALEVTGAERGFIMLANASSELEFKIARGRGRLTLSGKQFETSRKIPEEVFSTGQEKIVADLLDGDLANVHMGTVALGIRHVLCTPLRLVRYLDRADQQTEEKRIGVLYLDSREKGALLSRAARTALETLATEAAVAIENARLYRETLEKGKMEQEMRIAADIQQALLPEPSRKGPFFDAFGQSVASRSIGGDFFDYVDLPSGAFGFAVGDVAGKGAPAALLTAVIQGVFSSWAQTGASPSETLSRVNQALLKRAIESRFCTAFYASISADGSLTYCNAGHNPPMVFTANGVKRLETGGLILGLFEHATFEEETISLDSGDLLITFSDGVTEAMSASGEEYGEDRLLACVEAHRQRTTRELIDAIFASVREFSVGAVQSDDVTALVLRYEGPK